MHSTEPLRPPALRAGDTVAIISPAGPVLPQHVTQGIKIIESWGLLPQHFGTFARDESGYLAGDDAHRARELQRAIQSDCAAVLCSRGGYGVMRILDAIDLTPLRTKPKLIAGFSDITALHLAANSLDIPTLHSPVVKSFSSQSLHVPSLKRALFGQRSQAELTFPVRCVNSGRATGMVIGGNLSLVIAMLASKHIPDLGGALLVLEDIGEADYRLDRLFTALRLATHDRPLGGIILGDFTDCGGVYVSDNEIPAFVDRLAREFDVPVVADFPAGHGPNNTALPMGVVATLDANAGTLTFLHDVALPHA